ncbi:MAG: hypothetical protein EHM14_00925 [Methanothrix sp.]|nr:MAG: hypothetical protein EHM14_00925 [Methanothrix sp.]
MNKYLQAFFLLLLVAGSAAAYEYRMPVNVQCTSNPVVLMPGDEALLAVEMQSGTASYGVGKDAGSGSTAQSSLLSTPINKTVLKGTKDLTVLTADYTNLGMIGPDDRITAYYKIKASNNITSGTYLLGFQVQGGYDMITINRELPIKVDSAAVNMARAEASTTKQSFNLNVANPRENTLNAVTIVPSAEGIKFSPDEYYIGTMDPDEVFTISFALESADASKQLKGATNVSFVAKFKNGDTWHQSLPYLSSYTPPVDTTKQNSYLMPAGIAIVILIAAGVYLYRKNKLPIKPKNGNRQA